MLDTDTALLDLIVAPVLAAAFAFPRTPLLVMNSLILLATRTFFVGNANNIDHLSVDETLEL
jgi:hypothetical protein